jgi:hypothetical protein
MTASGELAAAAPRTARRVPEFFIVGHHKSGTTALYQMLRRHPQLYLPDVKEPRFFDSDLKELAQPSPLTSLPETLEEYLELFAPARPDQRLGEASPSYLRSRAAARAIAAVQPRARCIAILREPASFVRSLHLQLVQEHVERETDLGRALASEQITRDGRSWTRYSDNVSYVEQLQRYRDAFPAEQLLVLIYEEFRADNEATVRRVLRFLDVDDEVPIEVIDANPTVSVRRPRMDRAVRALYGGSGPLARTARGAVKSLTSAGARAGMLRTLRRRVVYGAPAPVDEQVMAELRRRFRPEVQALSDYLQRDLLTLWGYDRLA